MLHRALELADALRATLAGEVARARAEREVLRTLDADRILSRAAERAIFNDEVKRVERALAEALRAAASELGLADLSLPRLAARAPAEAGRLARTLADVRALAGTLSHLDALNRTLATRALACVQGYLNALRPAPAAYDRRGARAPAAPSQAAYSSKA